MDQMPVWGNKLWIRTLNIYKRAELPDYVISPMSGPPPQRKQDKAQKKDTHPVPGSK